MTKDVYAHARAQAQRRYLAMLKEAGSPLLEAGEGVREQLIGQFSAIYDAAGAVSDTAMVEVLSLSIGHSRAAARIHPAASLAAANMIFAASLPALTEVFSHRGVADPQTTAALRLNEAILRRMAAAAEAYMLRLTRRTAAHSTDAPVLRDAPSVLTTRERDVLAAAADGGTNRDIAEALCISEATVKRHLATIYRKLDARSRVQAMERARELGLLRP